MNYPVYYHFQPTTLERLFDITKMKKKWIFTLSVYYIYRNFNSPTVHNRKIKQQGIWLWWITQFQRNVFHILKLYKLKKMTCLWNYSIKWMAKLLCSIRCYFVILTYHWHTALICLQSHELYDYQLYFRNDILLSDFTNDFTP